jgi:hypothetical protein
MNAQVLVCENFIKLRHIISICRYISKKGQAWRPAPTVRIPNSKIDIKNEDISHAAGIFEVAGTSVPSNSIDPYGMTRIGPRITRIFTD